MGQLQIRVNCAAVWILVQYKRKLLLFVRAVRMARGRERNRGGAGWELGGRGDGADAFSCNRALCSRLFKCLPAAVATLRGMALVVSGFRLTWISMNLPWPLGFLSGWYL